jgi:hypothetical protein
MAAVASMFFLALETTPLFIAAYTFAIVGIAALGLGTTYLMNSGKSYPWFAAFPMAIWSYLTAQLLFSAIFVFIENMANWSFPIQWFVLIHVVLFAFTAVVLIALNQGKDAIERRGALVAEKVFSLKMLVADLDAASERLPSMKDEIKAAADELRYSDPISSPALAKYDDAIGNSVASIEVAVAKGNEQSIPALCAELLRQIKDRNNRVKLMK